MLVSIDAEETTQKVISCLDVLKSLTTYLCNVEDMFLKSIPKRNIK